METKQNKRIKKNAMAAILIMQLGLSYKAEAQNEINVLNNSQPNIGNTYVNINNGPAQFASVNTGNQNNARQLTNVSVTNSNKPMASNNPKPTTVKKKRPQHNPELVQTMPTISNTTFLAVQQAINVSYVNMDNNATDNNLQANIELENVFSNSPSLANSNVNANTNDKAIHHVSLSLNISKKSSHNSYRSKHNGIKHFRYSVNKKISKFFAKAKKNKFDTVACFVWR